MKYRTTYQPRHRRRSSTGVSSFLMPFLILICVGIIGVLLFNLWKALFVDESKTAAYMHLVEGTAQMKDWGTDDFFPLDTDVIVMTGDEILASGDARIIIEFFDGTLMRMDGGADVLFEEINDVVENPEIRVLLLEGKIWFNKVYKNTAGTMITVVTDNIHVKSDNSSNFGVENEFDEFVRVIHGDDVLVDILSEDDDKVVETQQVGVGQELVLSDDNLREFWAFQSPNVISGLSDIFKRSEWYLWNFSEDKSPTQFKKIVGGNAGQFVEVPPKALENGDADDLVDDVEPGEVDDSTDGVEPDLADDSVDVLKDDLTASEEGDEQPEVEESDPSPTGSLSKPTITSVAGVTETNENGFYVISSKVGTLTGGVSGASKVTVNDYTLTKFTAGDASWTYYANADFNLMQPGENTYEVFAIDENGTKSEALIVKVLYKPVAAAPAPEPEPEADPEPDPEEAVVPEESTEEPLEEFSG